VKLESSYRLAFKNECTKNCDYCNDFGARSKQNMSLLDTDRVKNKAANYKSVIVPCNYKSYDKKFVNLILSEGQEAVYQVQLEDYLSLSLYNDESRIFEVITDDYLSLLKIESFNLNNIKNIRLIVKKNNFKKIIKNWFKILDKVRQIIKFHFMQNDKSKLKCRTLFKFHKKLLLLDKTIRQDQFIANFDLFEPRVADDMELEAEYKPIFENKIKYSDISLSVVIPSYNNKNEVMQTLKHLNNQQMEKKSYEIILVDDGSTDGTSKFIIENFKKLGYQVNFKLIHYPRVIPRKPGDKRFRAGLARNLGVKVAVGENLLFCDADIIFSKTSLEQILKELNSYDVIQIQRHYLNQGVSVNQLNKPDFDVDKNTFHPNNGYWNNFYTNGDDWMKMSAPWKYICTFGLALKRKDFINSGRFRKVFLNYGFEDTDLGYRLFKMNKVFKLSSVKAYHQFGKFERNEYAHSSFKRHNLLSTTAKIFYRHYVDPDIYKELPSFLRV